MKKLGLTYTHATYYQIEYPKGPTVSTGTSTEHTERTYMGKDPEEEQIHVCALLNQVPVHLKQTQVQISNLLQQKIKKLPKKTKQTKKHWIAGLCCLFVAAFGDNSCKTWADGH